ncbi:unnamed protein product [Paramecium octaurelia]|uniref:Troponin C n=1 Tax=Paramecium octaurelia TaxID=43137 RepID=A0A8S1SMS1_PAROT|nr:unnamed protein product [Paramecium octaurelia]
MIEEVDGYGEVDFDEFIGLIGKRMKIEETNEELNQAFIALDFDKDGVLSKTDKQLGQQKLPDYDLDELFQKARQRWQIQF